MFRINITSSQAWLVKGAPPAVVLVGANLIFNVIANLSFKLAAFSPTWRSFLGWQIIGNLAGLITVLTLTALLRFLPLHVAYPVTTGLAILGVTVAAAGLHRLLHASGIAPWRHEAAGLMFQESISTPQWLGVLLIIAGIVLVSGR